MWRWVSRGGDGLDALISGVVAHDQTCGVHLREADADLPFAVVWPAGTVIVATDPVTLRLPGAGEASVGQEVFGGGGYHRLGRPVDAACSPTGETAVFNASERLTIAD